MKRLIMLIQPNLMLVLLICTLLISHPFIAKGEEDNEAVPVVLTNARSMKFEERLTVTGTVESKETAVISARIGGILNRIHVDEGDVVKAGTSLFQTNKVNLKQAKDVASQEVAVAAASVEVRKATVSRVSVELAKAKLDFQRYERLYKRDQAVSRHAFEVQESRYKQLQAALKEARAALKLAKARKKQAESNLTIAEKNLADSDVRAPFVGEVVQRFLEPGELAEAGTPVLRLQNPEILEVVALAPAGTYATVKIGKTKVRGKRNGHRLSPHVVNYKSPAINPSLRTYEIKSLIKEPPEWVMPGARMDLTLVLKQRTGLGVPQSAVVDRGGKEAVFVLDANKVRKVVVETGLATNGWLEITEGEITHNSKVISMGQSRLNDGSVVNVIRKGQVE